MKSRPLVRTVLALPLVCGVLAWPDFLSAQSRDEIVAAAREIIEDARFCTLITLDETGAPRARAMDPFVPGEDFTIWLGTNRKTRKVADIQRDPRVALHYFPPEAYGYVSIYGKARLVDDPEEKSRRWKLGWEEYYPNPSEDYLLIAVTPERMEVVNERRGLPGDPATWKPSSIEWPPAKPPQ